MKIPAHLMLFITFIIIATSQVMAQANLRYLDQNRSLIDWANQDQEEWLSFKRFEARQKLKDAKPEWEKILLEKNRAETVGRVIDCIGNCRNYKGLGFNNTRFRSVLREGDEFTTVGNSYAWIYLFDGTIVRVSPDSSITFKEINISQDEFFIHARVNFGNIVWLSREKQLLLEHNDRETDTYFLPISLFDANRIQQDKSAREDDLISLLDESKDNLNHLKKLNAMVEKNNKIMDKRRTLALIVAPNGSVSGYDLMLEFVVLVGGNSYIKKRTREFQGYPKETPNPNVTFYFRGFENQATLKLPDQEWMEIERNGRSIEPYIKPEQFGFGELLSKRVTTIMIAREKFFKNYTEPLILAKRPLDLARDFGYRTWSAINFEQETGLRSDMFKRYQFLLEYTRRLETSNILNTNKLTRKLTERGDKLKISNYSSRFYRTALATYLNNLEMSESADSDREVLNSTTKKYWKMINAKR
jgi:hypothetical protein